MYVNSKEYKFGWVDYSVKITELLQSTPVITYY